MITVILGQRRGVGGVLDISDNMGYEVPTHTQMILLQPLTKIGIVMGKYEDDFDTSSIWQVHYYEETYR